MTVTTDKLAGMAGLAAIEKQEIRAVAREPRNAAAVVFYSSRATFLT